MGCLLLRRKEYGVNYIWNATVCFIHIRLNMDLPSVDGYSNLERLGEG